MYESKLVAALKVNGKILREVKDTVYVPFGSEYSIYLKNLNSVRALVNIQIDGQEVCPSGLVLDVNREVDLERFIKDNNLTSGNAFKFIERTAGIEAHRGIKAEDGIIRISFKFEKPRPAFVNAPLGQWPGSAPWPGYWPPGVRGTTGGGTDWYSTTNAGGETLDANVQTKGVSKGISRGIHTSNATFGATSASVTQASYSAPVNDAGITVPGSVSNQTFSTTTMGAMETEEHVIVLRILGETEQGVQVQAPVTVKNKPVCSSCGRTNKSTARFCTDCGTGLIIC